VTQQPIDDRSKVARTPIDDSQWNLIAESGWLVGQHFEIAGQVVLGREAGCDIVIPGTHLSRRHAQLDCRGANLAISDLGSANGTYVNEVRVKEAQLKQGDTVRFDVLTFRVQAPRWATNDNALNLNATIIRPSPNKIKPTTTASPTAARIRASNERSRTREKQDVEPSAPSTPALSLLGVVAAIVVLATIASIGYLISQL